MNSLKLLSTVTRHTQITKVFVRKINNQNLIPKVDFSWKEDKIIDTISKAAQSGGPGFFYLENHGINSSVFENAIEQSNLFYSTTSMEQKDAITNHGYAGAPPGKSSKGKDLSK
jgi:isopenicillin N synthase-like dioxygenase